MIVSINQPAYLPWLGYFHRIAISDLHIVLDHVQFEKNSFTNRNKLRTKEGSCWLTAPVKTKGKFGELGINKVETASELRWTAKHAATIRFNYAKAAHYTENAAYLEQIYARDWPVLNDLLREMTPYMLKAFGIKTRIVYSSDMAPEGSKDDLVLNLCRAAKATTYISGPLGRNYLREGLFQEAGIRVVYHDYVHPTYPQAFPGFEPYMAALDLLLNCGDESLKVLSSGQPSLL